MRGSTCVVLALCLSCVLAGPANAQDAPPTAAEAPQPEPESAAAPSPAPALGLPPTAVELPAEDAALNDALLAAELQKLGLDDIESGGSVDTSLHLSGFADFSLMSLFGKAGDWRGAFERFPAFSIGNFNLYIDKRLSQTLRMFGEVRLSFLPNGTAPPGAAPGEFQSTASEDYANFKRPVRWGGIIIPRVYLEWAPFRFFGVRAGVFLTPYGIWNVDHGSPTIIPVQRPLAVGVAMFPERQTGLEVLGQFDISNHSTIVTTSPSRTVSAPSMSIAISTPTKPWARACTGRTMASVSYASVARCFMVPTRPLTNEQDLARTANTWSSRKRSSESWTCSRSRATSNGSMAGCCCNPS
jgi:hypothetical protein